jgi:hypothetical protein
MRTGTVPFITRANFQQFLKKVFSRDSFSWSKKEQLCDASDREKPVIFKNYFADLPASNSTRTGAIVFVAIDRRTRIVSFRQ